MENVKENILSLIDIVEGVIDGEKQHQKTDKAKLRKVKKFMGDIVELGLMSEDNTMTEDIENKVNKRATELRILKKVLYRLNKCVDLINGDEVLEEVEEVEETTETIELPTFE